jgi:mRNA interferase RelE/StbE
VHRVEFERAAKKELDRLPKSTGDRIVRAIAALREEPRRQAAKVKGFTNVFRIRVGDHRVIFEVDDDKRAIAILRIRKRDERTYEL